MHLGFRLLFAFFLLSGLTAWFALRVLLGEVKPTVREVVEDSLVDTAHLAAELAAVEMQRDPTLAGLRERLQRLSRREVGAQIWGLRKERLDLRVYLTDAQGRLLIDTGSDGAAPDAPGTDYARWNDVQRTLRGEYGARATRLQAEDENSLVLHVAAPVLGAQGERLGVVSVGKPVRALAPFVARAEQRVWRLGLGLLAFSLLLGAAVTVWLVWNVRRLRRYALQVQAGEPSQAPALAGELGELARAMDRMRLRLEGRAHWERRVRALTHELKSPLTGLRGAGELLQDPLPEADRQRFAVQVVEQSERLRQLVDRLLELSRLEALPAAARQPLRLDRLVRQVAQELAPRCVRQPLTGLDALPAVTVQGDAELLSLLLHNVLANALDFGPPGAPVELALQRQGAEACLTVRDRGPGVPADTLGKLGEPFFSTTRPDGRKGSGLGLSIARQVAALHGGQLRVEAADPGLRVHFTVPSHSP